MTATERQRRFRQRHPGYYGRLHARRRVASKARVEVMKLQAQAALPATAQTLALPAPLAIPIPVRLALPAPVETIEIPGMTTIAPRREAVLEPLARLASAAADRSIIR